MLKPSESITRKFKGVDLQIEFDNSVEQDPRYPGYPLTDDPLEKLIKFSNIESLRYEKYISLITNQHNNEVEELKKRIRFLEDTKTTEVIVKLSFEYRSYTLKIKMINTPYSDQTIKEFLYRKYPELQKFRILDVIKAGEIRIRRSDNDPDYRNLDSIEYEE